MSESFITKYRPSTFDEVYGNVDVLSNLMDVMTRSDHPHTYLITGPSGIGKTSIARLIGDFFGAYVEDMDAASNSGVADMRALVERAQYPSLHSDNNRWLCIIDECQTLSKNAWEALLKVAEEPPEHFYLVLCTTEPAKVPVTVRRRTYEVALQRLVLPVIDQYLFAIAEAEGWQIHPDVMNAIVQASEGSPGRALMFLLELHNAIDRSDVSRVAILMDLGEPLVQLCQVLMRELKPNWHIIRPYVAKISDDQFEGALIHMGRYFVSALLRATDFNQTVRLLALIDAITFPTETFDPKLKFIAVLGRIIRG